MFTIGLPNELIEQICLSCDASDLVSLSQTNRKFYHVVAHTPACWKILCQIDFDIQLSSCGKFPSYLELYKYLYCSRILIGCYTYGRYFEGLKPRMPNWLMHWASLSRQMPTMKYGKNRVRGKVRGFYLRHFNEIPYGKIRQIYNMNSEDVSDLRPTRFLRRTFYFSYDSIKQAGFNKHGSTNNFTHFLLDKCHRSRGYISRNYQKVRQANPLPPL